MALGVPLFVLEETTVIRLGTARVGCGNLWEREYTLPDGSTARGLTARLALGETVLYAGAGSELCVDGAQYRVVGIDRSLASSGACGWRRSADPRAAHAQVSRMPTFFVELLRAAVTAARAALLVRFDRRASSTAALRLAQELRDSIHASISWSRWSSRPQ